MPACRKGPILCGPNHTPRADRDRLARGVVPSSARQEQAMADNGHRIERDSMGELKVPASALWGAQTQRAVENFPVSGLAMPRAFIRALGLIKWAAAGANGELALLPTAKAMAIQAAALEVAGG